MPNAKLPSTRFIGSLHNAEDTEDARLHCGNGSRTTVPSSANGSTGGGKPRCAQEKPAFQPALRYIELPRRASRGLAQRGEELRSEEHTSELQSRGLIS